MDIVGYGSGKDWITKDLQVMQWGRVGGYYLKFI